MRQGRAFGIHVLLGSQTLGGAYTLARSTIGQMAVRIALQCSEADAHLILSEDNTAARLLTRPGEAIYNDANGLYEGNHPFQVVWLADDRARRLSASASAQMARSGICARRRRSCSRATSWPTWATTPACEAARGRRAGPTTGAASLAWLGSAVAIKDPTAAVFLRQNGGNLLMVGHREEAALGTLAACFLSLVAQHRPRRRRAGTVAGRGSTSSTACEPMPRRPVLAAADGRGAARGAPSAARARRRRSSAKSPPRWPPGSSTAVRTSRRCTCFSYNLGRFRELRKSDDFGYGSDEGPPSPAKQFATILREGPPLGVHALVWCDTYSNVTRLLDRQSMQDFEMRVLFQMNANDSSSLIDSPEAARLGVHRAIFYDEGQGLLEKFRPYGLPTNEFSAWTQKQLKSRCR